MAPSMMEDYDLDLSTGGFDEIDIMAVSPHKASIAINATAAASDSSAAATATSTTTTTTTTNVTTTRRRRRPVSFNPKVRVINIMTLDEYTDEEFKASWFDIDDMEKMKEHVRYEAMFLNAILHDKGVSSTLGLESRTREGLLAKRRNRRNAYTAVFFEIDAQEEENIFSDELIAKAYSVYSEPCTMAARTIAKEVELEVTKNSSSSSRKSSSTASSGTNDLKSHFRKTKRSGRQYRKRIVTLAPRNGLMNSAA